jgi:predicted small secreted protein
MKLFPTVMIVIAATLLSACGITPNSSGADITNGADAAKVSKSTPVAKSVPVATDDRVDAVDAGNQADGAGENAGLGAIVYNGKPLIECGRRLRTGSRIPRQVCSPDGYNGMYPSGGINVGTAKESQVGYGNN